ncbi:MAG: helix-turn-helix transcriptional regulator [Anaerolineae bacterium]|nr:helix-turn-helix transcriptional regulator [Anaerolineae bacterium]
MTYKECVDEFAALADPTRRQILEKIANRGQLSATEISDQFAISPQAISQHLKVLLEAELLLVERRAQQRIYRINPTTMQKLSIWASQLAQLWEQRFSALDELLEEDKKREQETKKQDKRGAKP